MLTIEIKINGKPFEKYIVTQHKPIGSESPDGWHTYLVNKKFFVSHYRKEGAIKLAYRVLAKILGIYCP